MQKLFAPGISLEDFQEGITVKRTIVVEDDNLLRTNIMNCFERSALKPFCAQDYNTAKRLIYPRFENVSRFRYAIIDDIFPEKRADKPNYLANKVIDELLKEHPDIRIFGYVEDETNIDQNKCVKVLKKDTVP